MVRLPPRPILGWKEIAARARMFSEEYRLAQRQFPLDVEEIAEFDLGIEIRLCSGVLEEFGSPAQIAPGGRHLILTVDTDQYRQQTSFYRYSVAHEIGHYVLHREWLQKVWQLIDSVESWKQVIASRSEEDYKWIEGQAEEFASYLLAPETVFEPFLAKQIALVKKIDIQLQSEDVLPYLANPVGEFFWDEQLSRSGKDQKKRSMVATGNSTKWRRLITRRYQDLKMSRRKKEQLDSPELGQYFM